MYFWAAGSSADHGRLAQDGSLLLAVTHSRQPGGSQTGAAGLGKLVCPAPLIETGRSTLFSQLTNRWRVTPTPLTEAQACAFPSSRLMSIPR